MNTNDRPEHERRDPGAPAAEPRPRATENAALPEDVAGVSDFGGTGAKREALAAEQRRQPESGSVATQDAYLAREAAISDTERERRARAADIHNTTNYQAKNDHVLPRDDGEHRHERRE